MQSVPGKIEKGRGAEKIVAERLQAQGFRILRKNWREPRRWGGGEIDLLFERGGLLWIVEVKSVAASRLGTAPLLSEAQLRRLRRSAVIVGAEYRRSVRICLAWWDPEKRALEIVENP